MASSEIEELLAQLKAKKEEVKAIYDKLVEAGALSIPDDFLAAVAGGGHTQGGALTPTASWDPSSGVPTEIDYGPRA